MTPPVIRPLEAGDRDMMERFFDQMAPDTRAFFNRGDGNRRWAMRFFDGTDDRAMRRWIGVSEGQIAGYVFLWDVDTRIPWLGVAVSESMRGRRFGQQLIETAEAWCREQNMGGILLTTHMANVRAQALYERCGFVRMGISNQDNEILYLKRL